MPATRSTSRWWVFHPDNTIKPLLWGGKEVVDAIIKSDGAEIRYSRNAEAPPNEWMHGMIRGSFTVEFHEDVSVETAKESIHCEMILLVMLKERYMRHADGTFHRIPDATGKEWVFGEDIIVHGDVTDVPVMDTIELSPTVRVDFLAGEGKPNKFMDAIVGLPTPSFRVWDTKLLTSKSITRALIDLHRTVAVIFSDGRIRLFSFRYFIHLCGDEYEWDKIDVYDGFVTIVMKTVVEGEDVTAYFVRDADSCVSSIIPSNRAKDLHEQVLKEGMRQARSLRSAKHTHV